MIKSTRKAVVFLSFFMLPLAVGAGNGERADRYGTPVLYRKVKVPEALLAPGGYAGDIRIGDLTGNGTVDFLVYRSVDDAHDGGGLKPCFIGAFNAGGDVIWSVGQGGVQPSRPGPVTIHDIDRDGRSEVICFFLDRGKPSAPDSMGNVVLQIRDGATGDVEKEAAPDALTTRSMQDGANWVHQRLLVSNFRGGDHPRDMLVKLGNTLIAFDNDLHVLWTYTIQWNTYGAASAYTPAVGDLDGDGRDEVNGGLYVLDHEGTPLWERFLAKNMDCALIDEWDNGRQRAFCSGGGFVMTHAGDTIVHLGENEVPHGQELRVGDFIDSLAGPEMIIRYNGHNREVMTVSNEGNIVQRFLLNSSPNNTGMETVRWHGHHKEDVLYNGGVLWCGDGTRLATLPDLPPPAGPARMGWYHCVPANVAGDEREEVVLYNPWDRYVYIYSPHPVDDRVYSGYDPGPRQYNVRIMD